MRIVRWLSVASGLTALTLSAAAAADDLPINKGAKAPPAVSAQVVSPQAISAPQPNPMEMVYTPITPCRAFSAQAMTVNQTRNFQITGAGSMTAQGGPATGCGIPASALAVSLGLTTTNTSYPGFMTVFATGSTRTATTSVTLQSTNTTTGLMAALGPAGNVSVFSNKAAKVFGDITGYYAPQIHVYMNADGTAVSATNRILSTSRGSLGSYTIETDRNIQLCSVHVNIAGGYYYASAYQSGNFVYVNTWTITNGSVVAKDLFHNVTVHC